MNFFYYFKIFILIIFNTKFKFRKPINSEFLLYDQGIKFNETIKNLLNNYKVTVLHVRFEELNIYIILSVVFKLKFLNRNSFFQNYLNEFCNHAKPKIIISSALWDTKLFKIKENFNGKVKIVLVQKFPIKNNFFVNFNKKYKVDAVFVFNNISKKILSKYFKTKFVKIGIIQNNNFKKSLNKNVNKKILVISGYRKIFENNNPKLEWEKNLYHEKKIVKILHNTKIFKYKFKILLKPLEDVKNYIKFMNCKNSNIIFNNQKLYKLIDQFDLLILINNGTVGYEAISRGIKSIQFTRKKYREYDSFYVFNKNYNSTNIINFIKKFLDLPTRSFFRLCKKNNIDVPIYDFKNNILKRYLIKEIKSLR